MKIASFIPIDAYKTFECFSFLIPSITPPPALLRHSIIRWQRKRHTVAVGYTGAEGGEGAGAVGPWGARGDGFD